MSDSQQLAFRHRLEFGVVTLFSWIFRALPRTTALSLGAGLGWIAWCLRIRRTRVLKNLAVALPDTSTDRRIDIGRQSAQNFGRTVAEFLRFPGGDRDRVLELVQLEGLELLRERQQRGESSILITGHLGSWALYVTALASAGIQSSLLVGKQTNPMVDAMILSLPGGHVEFISKAKSSPRVILQAIKQGRVIVMVADHYSSDQRVLAPFMGKEAYTLPLPGALAERHKLPLFLMAGHRQVDGRHHVAVRPLEYEEGNERAVTRQNVAVSFNRALGDAILEEPEQYFWYHDRWKKRIRSPGKEELLDPT